MRTFANPLAFATFLTEMTVGIDGVQRTVLERAAQIVEDEAKRVLGTYDYGWPPLAPSTVARKAAGDSPLLETGELRDSIAHNIDHPSPAALGGRWMGVGVHPMSAFVGSDNDKAVWHEFGTSRVPPRPFLSQALIREEARVVTLVGSAIAGFIANQDAGLKRVII